MLIWLVAALGFVICLSVWHLWQGITRAEAIGMFLATSMAFISEAHYIYTKNTTDTYLSSGYISSKIYRPSYTYTYKNKTYTEPEHWILEQSAENVDALQPVEINRYYQSNHGTQMETCLGRCLLRFGEVGSGNHQLGTYLGAPVFAFDVSEAKYQRTLLGSPSVAPLSYFNPVMSSDDAFYNGTDFKLPYFKITDTNLTHRILAPSTTPEEQTRLERLNASLATRSSMSLSLIISPDSLLYEKLRRAWHGGKANDFIVVVQSPDNRTIRNTNVLTWNNYALAQTVEQAIGSLPSVNIDLILQTLEKTLPTAQPFVPQTFEKLRFMQIKIPTKDYICIFSYQTLLVIYLLTLLNLNPLTKNTPTDWEELGRTWDKHNRPHNLRYYLHPFSSTGIFFFYTFGPFFFFQVWAALFN